jgi:hypothetical protein
MEQAVMERVEREQVLKACQNLRGNIMDIMAGLSLDIPLDYDEFLALGDAIRVSKQIEEKMACRVVGKSSMKVVLH